MGVSVRVNRSARPDPVRLARVALACLAQDGDVQVQQLAQTYGPEAALDRLLAGAEPDIDTTRYGDIRQRTTEMLRQTKRLRARIVTPEDAEWPVQLNELAKLDGDDDGRQPLPPLCLWVRGKPALAELLHQAVAVVGARAAATSYGNHVSTELGYALAQRGWTVVSGGAYGVDAAAHRGALTAKGPTVAFLAGGVDRSYPASNTALFDRIAEGGLLVSQWPPGTTAFKFRFTLRCGVIAASTRAAVMVEATTHSQARRTLGHALALGRPVLVVPGPVTSVLSAGCHQFLRQHPAARLVTNAAEVIHEIEQGGGRDHHE